MANVLISFWGPVLDNDPYGLLCFYESLAKVLNDNGNNVLIIIMNHFKEYHSVKIQNEEIEKDVLSQIDSFDPDLIISFNHQLLSIWRTRYNCPIGVWDADSIELFSNIDDFKKNIDRYTIFTLCKTWIKNYENIGASKNKIFYISPSTYLTPKNMIQDKNISIIASRFGMPPKSLEIMKNGEKNNTLYDIFLSSLKKHSFDFNREISKTEDSKLLKLNKVDIWHLFDNRNLILSSILDLGLNLYGVNWEDIAEYNPQLLFSYKKDNKYSIKDNEYVYNSSKICLNINHNQTEGKCFSWRVMDIMATNGCLVSGYTSELVDLTKDYVEIPMFKNHLDVRETCKNILDNEELREETIKGSQEYVKENANFADRLVDISEATNVKLLNNNTKGYLNHVIKNNFKIEKNEIISKKNSKDNKKRISSNKNKNLKLEVKSNSDYNSNIISKIKNKILMQSNQYVFYKKSVNNTIKKNKKLKNELIRKNRKIKQLIKNDDIRSKELEVLKLKNEIRNLEDKLISKDNEIFLLNRNKFFEKNINLIKLNNKLGKKIKVVFLTYYNIWSNEVLYKLLDEDPCFDVEIIIVPYMYNHNEKLKIDEYDYFYNFLKKNHNVTRGYDIKNEKTIDLMSMEIDILFYASPWMDIFPEDLRISNIPSNILVCYIPYGICIAELQEHQFNMELNHKAWKIFVETPIHESLAWKYSDYGGDNVLTTGYPKMDSLIDGSHVNSKFNWKNKDSTKIIWSPHWTFEDPRINFSTFDKNYEFFFNYVKRNKNVEFVLKPHPLLKKALIEQEILTLDEVENFFDRFEKLNNASYYGGSDYMNLFATSDAMITDGVSYLAEYLYCNKPGLHLTKNTQTYNEFGDEVVKVWYECEGDNFECIENFIKDIVIKKNDSLKSERESFYKKNLRIDNNKLASELIYDIFRKTFIH